MTGEQAMEPIEADGGVPVVDFTMDTAAGTASEPDRRRSRDCAVPVVRGLLSNEPHVHRQSAWH